MLKLILALISDWRAYRRAMSWGAPAGFAWAGLSLGDVSIWPVEAEAAVGA